MSGTSSGDEMTKALRAPTTKRSGSRTADLQYDRLKADPGTD